MLQLKNIVKTYITGDLTQDALQGVSINFRENEFVSILGQSGSGKTTMLNIIGGLDRYSSGDLVINGVSTKRYKDSDWDYYRNNSIGFVKWAQLQRGRLPYVIYSCFQNIFQRDLSFQPPFYFGVMR